MTQEEREKTLAFIRETLAREPDAHPLRSLRFLLTELDRVKAEGKEWRRLMNAAYQEAECERDAALAKAKAAEKALETAIEALRNWQPLLSPPPDVSGAEMYRRGQELFTAVLGARDAHREPIP